MTIATSKPSPTGAVLGRLLLALSLFAPAACATARPAGPSGGGTSAEDPAARTGDAIKTALAGAHRSPENAARDKYRHPYETLMFFGLRDTMTVVELYPGAGWYTEVLAPVLKQHGRLLVTSVDPNSPDTYNANHAKELLALKANHPDVFGKFEIQTIDPKGDLVFGPPGSADMVVCFRSLHGWIPKTVDKNLAAIVAVLKPGGVFGIEGHRANPGGEIKGGYVPEAEVIRLIEAAGLKLVDKSEVNANPKDTKDYPKGVWTLPPSLELGDQDRDKYLAIGESDRFTLRFVKP